MTWADLFERADGRGITIDEIRNALEARRDDG